MITRRPFSHLCGLVFAYTLLDSAWHSDSLAATAGNDAHQLLRREAASTAKDEQWEISKAGSVIAPHDRGRAMEVDSGEYHVVLMAGLDGPVTWKEQSSSQSSSGSPANELMQMSKFSLLESRSSSPVLTKVKHRQSSSSERKFTVECEDGYTCVGGGCLARRASDLVTGLKDPTREGWRCTSEDKAQDKTKKVWAICALTCKTFDGECNGEKVNDKDHICAQKPCTKTECCKPPPSCAGFSETCPDNLVKKPDDTKCTAYSCSAADCCKGPQKCTEWSGSCECDNDGEGTHIKIPNFHHHACKGAKCTPDECCEHAPKCSSFSDDNCNSEKTFHRDRTCCSGSCSCARCYE